MTITTLKTPTPQPTAMDKLPNPPQRCPKTFANPFAYSRMVLPLLEWFAEGTRKSTNPSYKERELLEAATHIIRIALERGGSTVCVGLESARLKNGPGRIRGFIVETDETTVIPVSISENLIRLRGAPIFVASKNGAVRLLNALLAELQPLMDGTHLEVGIEAAEAE
jgi:hypothetical protein